MSNEKSIKRLLDDCEASGNTNLKSVVLTALNTGMRLLEILNLRVNDLDFDNSLICIKNRKTKKGRQVPMNMDLRAILTEHLKEHQAQHVFCDHKGNALTSTALQRALRNTGTTIKFSDLRRYVASQLVASNVALITIQNILGYAKIDAMVKSVHHAMAENR